MKIPIQSNGLLITVVEVPDGSEAVVVPGKLINFVSEDRHKGIVYRLVEEQLPDGTYRKTISPKPPDWPDP